MSLDSAVRALFESAGTCAASDACERAGVPSRVTHVPARPGTAPVSGRIRTLRLRPVATGDKSSRHLGADLLDSCHLGDVILVSAPRDVRAGSWGELLLAGAAAVGVVAVVVDGYARDSAAATGVAVFSRGSAVRSARGRLIEQGFDVPVIVDDEVVQPGEFVIADQDGQVFIAPQDVSAVATALEHVLEMEGSLLEEIVSGSRGVAAVLDSRYEDLINPASTTRRSS
jgi:4-hydroxy-4-methyl-2-oxoglutarate aldolase